MKKIIEFPSLKDYIIFIGKKGCRQLIGEGAEGKCYLSKLDGNVYKLITNKDSNGNLIINYNINKIITTEDIHLENYILPEELYVVDNELIGYKTKYIKEKSVFAEQKPQEILKKLYNLKEKILIEAYYQILKETDILSKEKIEIYDLTYNLLFSEAKYYGIDTCGYEKTNNTTFLQAYNRYYLEEAIKQNFNEILTKTKRYSDDYLDELINIENMEDYTKTLIKVIKK